MLESTTGFESNTMKRVLLLGLVTALALGCENDPRIVPDGGVSVADAGADAGYDASGIVIRDAQAEDESCRQMDILFVIDDSGSMEEEQTNLVANFSRFIDVLNAFTISTGEALDYRIGVTTTGKDISLTVNFETPTGTTSMTTSESGPEGRLLAPSACGMDASQPWINSTDANVTDTFACLAAVGTSGSGIEMPLFMTELALTQRVLDGSNANFLRPDALLAVVVLTDEDDCSMDRDSVELTISTTNPAAAGDLCDREDPALLPTSRFLTQLDAVKGNRDRWAMAVIAGPNSETSCTSSFGDAAGAIRLHEFLGDVGENSSFSSICDGDLSIGLMDALDTFTQACDTFTLI